MIAALLAVALAAPPQAGPAPAPGSMTGVVQEAGSRSPIADARVTLVGPGVRETATADHAGRFTFMSLPPGAYRLAAERETFAFDPVGTPPVRVESRATATVIVPMQRAGVIVGDVRDERGNPRRGVPITALRTVAGGTANPPDARHTTNDMGEFRIDGLLAGDYIVLASPPSARVSTVALMPTYYPASTDKDAATTVKVNAGETSANVFITMVSAPAYAISGIVVDGQQRPLARALVAFVFQAVQTDAPGGQGSLQARVQILATRPDGTFRITGLGPGTYRLTPAPPPPSFPPPNQIEIMTSAIMGTRSTVNVDVRNADVSGVTVVLRPPQQ